MDIMSSIEDEVSSPKPMPLFDSDPHILW